MEFLFNFKMCPCKVLLRVTLYYVFIKEKKIVNLAVLHTLNQLDKKKIETALKESRIHFFLKF